MNYVYQHGRNEYGRMTEFLVRMFEVEVQYREIRRKQVPLMGPPEQLPGCASLKEYVPRRHKWAFHDLERAKEFRAWLEGYKQSRTEDVAMMLEIDSASMLDGAEYLQPEDVVFIVDPIKEVLVEKAFRKDTVVVKLVTPELRRAYCSRDRPSLCSWPNRG